MIKLNLLSLRNPIKFILLGFYILLFLISNSSCKWNNQSYLPKDNSGNYSKEGSINPSRLPKNLTKETSLKSYDSGDVVTGGIIDKDGKFWFGTSRNGLYCYDGKRFTNFTEDDGLCNNEIYSVLEDKNGVLWLGTSDGICIYNGKHFKHLPIPSNEHEKSKAVLGLFQDKEENIWLGTWGNGAYRYDGKKFKSFLREAGWIHPDGYYNNVIRNFIQDNENNIWISSLSHGGITRYDGQNFINYTEQDGLCDDMVFTSFIDSKGNIWLGGNEEGVLCRYDGKSFIHYTKSDGICDGFASCFYEDKLGNIWIGSEVENSLCIFDGKNFTPFSVEGSDKIPAVRFILEDKEHNIWFGGRYGSLWRYDSKTLTDFTHKY